MAISIPEDIRIFLDHLLEDAGFTHVSEAVGEQMREDLYARLDNKLIAAAFENMPAEHVDAFSVLVDKKASGGELNAFLSENVPHAKEIFANALIDFRNSYLGVGAAST